MMNRWKYQDLATVKKKKGERRRASGREVNKYWRYQLAVQMPGDRHLELQ